MKQAYVRWGGGGSFSFSPPTSRQLQLISVTSGFTRLSMKTKYVFRDLIGLYVNFHNNRTMWSINLHVKNCRWGGGERKRAGGGGGGVWVVESERKRAKLQY